jgi:hypothetical protein
VDGREYDLLIVDAEGKKNACNQTVRISYLQTIVTLWFLSPFSIGSKHSMQLTSLICNNFSLTVELTCLCLFFDLIDLLGMKLKVILGVPRYI